MIRRRKFGNTGIEVSEIGLGCWALGGNSYGPVSAREAENVMAEAVRHGIDLFDTADIYGFGESENRIGSFLKGGGRRKAVFLATKGGFNFENGPVRKDFSKTHLARALDQSLERLGLETVDLYQLHLPTKRDFQRGECLEFITEAKSAGKIRFGGASLYHPADIESWITHPEIDSIQFQYNLVEGGLEEALESFGTTGKALIAREIFACGFLSGRYSPASVFGKDDHRRAYSHGQKRAIFDRIHELQVQNNWSSEELFENALDFALKPREVSCALIGARNVEQFSEDLEIYQRKVFSS